VTGSEDSTIFSFAIMVTENFPVIIPIGFIKVPSGVTCLTWKPQCVNICYNIQGTSPKSRQIEQSLQTKFY